MVRKVFLAAMAGLVVAAQAHALEAGCEAPEITLPNRKLLSELRGRVVYVDFWASWCGPCQASFPWMEEMHKKYPDLDVIGVNVDTDQADAEAFLEKSKPSFRIVFDPEGKFPEQYGVERMPSSYVIGRDGKIVFTHRGFRESDKAVIEKEIQTQLGLSAK